MYTEAEDAVKLIKPGQCVFTPGGAATPHYSLRELARRSKERWNLKWVSIRLHGEAPELQPLIAFNTYEFERTAYWN